jgi:hypothetical protein
MLNPTYSTARLLAATHDNHLNVHGRAVHETYNGKLPASLSVAQHWGREDPSRDSYGSRSDSHAKLSNVVALPMRQNLSSVNVNNCF